MGMASNLNWLFDRTIDAYDREFERLASLGIDQISDQLDAITELLGIIAHEENAKYLHGFLLRLNRAEFWGKAGA